MSVTVAVIGTGDVANRVHLPAWKKNSAAHIVALCDTNQERVASMAEQWKIPKYYTQFAELLDSERPTIVDICTPPASHLPLAVQAMGRGCHVLLEKPMAMSIKESEEIVKAYAERKAEGIKLCVIHSLLYESLIPKLRSTLEKGIGDILGVEINLIDTPDDSMIANPEHWCHKLPGGRFGECLIHPIYLLQDILGPLQIESLWVTKAGPYPWVPYDELHVTLSSGERFGSIYASFNCPRASFPSITIYGKKSILRYEGSNCSLQSLSHLSSGTLNAGFDNISQVSKLLKSTAENFLRVTSGRLKKGHEVIFRLFLDSIINNRELPLPLTPEEAYQANKTYLQALERLEAVKKNSLETEYH